MNATEQTAEARYFIACRVWGSRRAKLLGHGGTLTRQRDRALQFTAQDADKALEQVKDLNQDWLLELQPVGLRHDN